MARPKKEVAKRLREVIDRIRSATAQKRGVDSALISYYDLEEIVGISHESIRRYDRGVSFPDRNSMAEKLAAAIDVPVEDLSYFLMSGKWPAKSTKEDIVEALAKYTPDEQWEIFRKASEKKMPSVV